MPKYRDRNGRCIAIIFKSIGVRGRFDSPDSRDFRHYRHYSTVEPPKRVVGWSAGRHVDHPSGGQVSPWPATKVSDTHTHTHTQERTRECCTCPLVTYPLNSALRDSRKLQEDPKGPKRDQKTSKGVTCCPLLPSHISPLTPSCYA